MSEPDLLDGSELVERTVLAPVAPALEGRLVALAPAPRPLDPELWARYARLVKQLDHPRRMAFEILMATLPDWSIKERCELLAQVHEAMYKEPPAGTRPEDWNLWFRVESGA